MATVYPEYTELTAVSDREMYRPLNYPVEIHTGDAQKCRLHLKLILADAILSFITHILAGDMSRRSRSSLRVLTEYRWTQCHVRNITLQNFPKIFWTT